MVGLKGIPSIVTYDGRTIRFPDPLIKLHDTIKLDLTTGKIDDFIKFDSGWSLLFCSFYFILFIHSQLIILFYLFVIDINDCMCAYLQLGFV